MSKSGTKKPVYYVVNQMTEAPVIASGASPGVRLGIAGSLRRGPTGDSALDAGNQIGFSLFMSAEVERGMREAIRRKTQTFFGQHRETGASLLCLPMAE